LSVVCLPQFSVDNIIWTERFPVLPLAEATIYMTESELNTMKLKNEVMNTVDTNNSNPWALQSSQTADLCQQNHPYDYCHKSTWQLQQERKLPA
jgi:hypothetical protein